MRDSSERFVLAFRQRTDTVRCSVSFLTDHRNPDLNAALMTRDSVLLDASDSEPEDLETDWKSWQPDPVDAAPGVCCVLVIICAFVCFSNYLCVICGFSNRMRAASGL